MAAMQGASSWPATASIWRSDHLSITLFPMTRLSSVAQPCFCVWKRPGGMGAALAGWGILIIPVFLFTN